MPVPSATTLLIGAGGLLGSALREALAGRAVVATSHIRPVAGTTVLDLTDRSAVRALVRKVTPATIMVAAAEPFVERCEVEPTFTRAVNVEPAIVLAEEANRIGATLVVLSSEYVFDGSAGAYREEDATAPLNEYGRQKVELEHIAATVGHHLICRTSGVFGWDAKRVSFVCALVDRLRGGTPFVVPSDQLITPTYAPALAREIVELVDRGASGVFHTCGPEIVNRLAFAREIAAAFDLRAELITGKRTAELGLRAQRPLAAGLSDAKVERTLGHGLPALASSLAEMRAGERR